jgi:hypothetical protein
VLEAQFTLVTWLPFFSVVIMVEWLALLFHIQKMSGSNLGLGPGYLD